MAFSIRTGLLHSVAAAVMAYGYMHLRELPFDVFIRTQKGGHGQYLTIIGSVNSCSCRFPCVLTVYHSLGMAFLCMVSGLGVDLFPGVTG